MDDITNRKLISSKIEKGQPVKLSFKYINEKILMILNSVLLKVLSKQDQIFLLNSIVTILREIIVNALKANAKRIYFKKSNMDIGDEKQYKLGMHKFKKEVVGDFNAIEDDLKRSDLFIEIDFEFSNDSIKIMVINNAPILPVELERISYRISKAYQYNDFSDAYAEIEDDTEGAGLGIVLAILLMKNMGIDPKNYKIERLGFNTVTSFVIPIDLKPQEIVTKVKIQIFQEIDGIPTFPENIMELQRLCHDPDSTIGHIVKRIKLDPALASDVIKLSNSAGISPGKRIEDIKTAVVIIGLKNLDAILVASNARRILNERYSHFELIWEHCNKVAFYGRNIAMTFHQSAIIENVYMAGLLHDLGKIILLATDKKLVKKIASIVENRKITTTTMEEISIGISHSSIGALIAKKWHFPDYLIESIKFHHAPLNCSDNYRDIIYAIYLANMMVGIENRIYNYYYIEESILEKYDLLDIEKFTALHEKLKNKYENMRKI